MARVSFDAAVNAENVTSVSTGGTSDVGFLILRNDGDEAIVRFMYDSIDEFDIHTVHTNVKVGERFREVNCLREPTDSIDKCPFCQAQMPLQQKFVIKMTQYIIDNTTGQITPKPVVWERSLAYARTLKGYLENYGPLTDVLCKIIRHGKAGDQRTTYEIIPNLNKQIYRDDLYPKNTDIFGDYTPLGRLIYDKDYAEMSTYLQTGNFPLRNNNVVKANNEPLVSIPPRADVTPRTYDTPRANTPTYGNGFANTTEAANVTGGYATPGYNATANFQAPPVTATQPQFTPPANNVTPARETLPWENPNNVTPASNAGFERPIRRY